MKKGWKIVVGILDAITKVWQIIREKKGEKNQVDNNLKSK